MKKEGKRERRRGRRMGVWGMTEGRRVWRGLRSARGFLWGWLRWVVVEEGGLRGALLEALLALVMSEAEADVVAEAEAAEEEFISMMFGDKGFFCGLLSEAYETEYRWTWTGSVCMCREGRAGRGGDCARVVLVEGLEDVSRIPPAGEVLRGVGVASAVGLGGSERAGRWYCWRISCSGEVLIGDEAVPAVEAEMGSAPG